MSGLTTCTGLHPAVKQGQDVTVINNLTEMATCDESAATLENLGQGLFGVQLEVFHAYCISLIAIIAQVIIEMHTL